VKFLIDENLSTRLVERLASDGHDVVHVRDVGLKAADDQVVLEHARDEDRVLVSADTDFGALLAASRASRPSVILLRLSTGRRVEQVAALIARTVDDLHEDLDEGSVIVLEQDRIRVRRLPLL
jgi:predicted nuclease of predicted toxin-antitoxin system